MGMKGVLHMKLSTVEKILIASPIVTNLVLSFAFMQLDVYLDAYTKYFFFGLVALTFYPIVAGALLRTKESLGFYLLMHILTALIAIYGIYNDSALIYLYLSVGLFVSTVGIAFVIRKIKHKKTP